MDPLGEREGDPPRQEPTGQEPTGQKPTARIAVPVTMLAVLAAGLILVLVPSAEEYGWFAYAPLAGQQPAGWAFVFLGVRAWLGISLAAAALLGLAFWAGFRAGSRRAGQGGS